MRCVLEINFPSASIARKAFKSLEQETSFRKRSRVEVKVRGGSLVITIEADSFPALRATANSYLRLLSTIHSVLNITKKEVWHGAPKRS
jgi:tRNA threonylcarbamoyladenosine modification (KEOPS) complex  Pcc1 subunit